MGTLHSMTEARLFLVCCALTLVLLLIKAIVDETRRRRKYKFPPSPPGRLPIVGHSHLLPKEFPGDKAKEWADQLGSDLMHLRLGGTDWVFLNSSRAVEDLLERRSAIYSSRPVFAMVGEVISRGKRPVLQPYGDQWRDVRKVMHLLLTGKSADLYRPMEDMESRQTMWELLHEPENWHLHLIRFAASFTVNMVYGVREQGRSALFDAVSNAQDEFLRNNVPGMWLVDQFPQLRKLPVWLQWWRPYGNKIYEETRAAFKGYYDLMERNAAAGTQKECFATKFYREVDTNKSPWFDFDQKLFIAGGLIEAGSDTTKNQLNILVAAMGADPNTWIAKARAELDAVCGSHIDDDDAATTTTAMRLPTFADWDRLPYIQAIMKESMRWRPNVNPTGFPHALIRDDEYAGYVLPAGTVVTINNWAISLNPKEYKDPEKFDPDRFLTGPDLWNPMKGHYGFGAGRRACAGSRVAQNSMFIFFSRFIYCFDVEEDPNSPIDTYHIPLTPPTPQQAFEPPFTAKIRIRSDAHRQLILKECRDVGVGDS